MLADYSPQMQEFLRRVLRSDVHMEETVEFNAAFNAKLRVWVGPDACTNDEAWLPGHAKLTRRIKSHGSRYLEIHGDCRNNGECNTWSNLGGYAFTWVPM